MKVREIMTSSPATCTRDSGLREVARMMVEHDCGAIPVVESNGRSGRVIGIVTDRDIVTRILGQGQNPLEKSARDAMTDSTITVHPDDSLDHCTRLMEKHQVRRLVVVDEDDRVTGIIAQADIARHASEEQTGELVEEVSRSQRR